jgi:polyisoprenoid-binding protein YceI
MTPTAIATLTRTLALDKAHSEVGFEVRHLLTRVRGRFTDFDGAIDYDPDAPERSTVTFAARTASIDTGEPQRDAHLRSADFFEADRYPSMTFVSRGIDRTDADRYVVTGDLTIRDVTRTIELPVTYLGAATDPWGNEKLGFEASITISRKDYGLAWNAVLETGGFLVGDDVKVNLSLQAAAAK